MKERDEKVIAFDLDGTLADYSGELSRQMNWIREPNTEPVYTADSFGGQRHPEWFENRRTLITSKVEFWQNLALLSDGMQIFDIATKEIGFTPHILTQGPSRKSEAWEGKHRWCLEHFPGVDLTVTRNKGLFYARVLVDDWPEYVFAWLEHRPRGLAIVPARSWNKDIKAHPNIIRVSMPTDQDLVKEHLQKAFDRD